MLYKKLEPWAQISRESEGAAGYDIFYPEDILLPCFSHDTVGGLSYEEVIKDFESPNVVKIKTGLAVALPQGHVMLAKERSSIGSHGVAVRAGVIDEDYRGELVICLMNLNPFKVRIPAGAFVQVVVVPCYQGELAEVSELDETARGDGGFGSTDQRMGKYETR